jgi:hypothetical protein
MRSLSMPIGCIALVGLMTTACGPAYAPAYSPRISVTSNGLERGGVVFSAGPFGGDVDQAVHGVPKAEDEMGRFQSQQTIGTIFTYVGLATFVVGSTMLQYADSRAAPDNHVAPAYAVGLTGLAMGVVGLFLQVSARGHLLDAVNIFNDTVATWSTPVPCPAQSSGSSIGRP